ncbi:MAG: VOC family protein [Acidimicrobiia bacterium]|nr:VOC family protein [Acidimicrobiia bacterium]
MSLGPVQPAGILIFTSLDRFEAMARFYRDTLGLPVRSDRQGFINFEFENQRLTVAVHSEVEGPSQDPKRIMINFATGDVEAAVAHLARAGVEIVRYAEREKWGGWVATFADPDGNLVQLLELPESTQE